jgi:hypothetical protein
VWTFRLLIACLAIGLFASTQVAGEDAGYEFSMALMVSMAWACVLGVPAAVFHARAHKRRVNLLRSVAAASLGRLGAPESIGPLAGALFDRSPDVQEAAALALHNVLPAVTHEHFGVFGSESIVNLGKALAHSDYSLVMKILTALAKIGTSHAVPYVKRASVQGRTTRIREMAMDVVLPALASHEQRENERQTLMRGASIRTSSPDYLLRPATETGESAPQQLLRPTGDES